MPLANAGVPMIVLELPGMAIALLPVVLLEAAIVRERLGVRFLDALAASLRANVLSTVAGVPLAWLCLLALQLWGGVAAAVAVQALGVEEEGPATLLAAAVLPAAWIVPFSPAWVAGALPLALAVFLVPSFLISLRLEEPVFRRRLVAIPAAAVRAAVRRANAFTYLALLAACAALALAGGPGGRP